MSNYTNVVFVHDEGQGDITERMTGQNSGSQIQVIERFSRYLGGIASGAYKAKVSWAPGAVQASGTFTLSSCVATNTAVVGGVTLTAVASGASTAQFNVGGSDTITATNLAAAINAHATLGSVFTASAVGAVVTVVTNHAGKLGNFVAITATGGIAASGALLTGGAASSVISFNFGGA